MTKLEADEPRFRWRNRVDYMSPGLYVRIGRRWRRIVPVRFKMTPKGLKALQNSPFGRHSRTGEAEYLRQLRWCYTCNRAVVPKSHVEAHEVSP